MYAQSLIEYGALASIVAGAQRTAETIRLWITTLSPTTWAIVVGVILVLLVAKGRRTRRW
jgi:hypothetical protein